MNIAKLSGDSAKKYYYEKDPVMNSSGSNENLSWMGKGATELGINGLIDKDDFESILDGKYKETTLRNTQQKTNGNDRKAYDLTLSASKSISHAGLVLGDEKVIDAVKKANDETMKYVESKFANTRVGKDRTIQKTDNLIIAQARHSVSRPVDDKVDPSLHTHNIIMNATKGEDGKWRSLDASALYDNQAHIQNVFNSHLAKNLKEVGYGIKTDKKGNIEIAGYDQATLDNFSKRKFEIARIKKELKADPKNEGLSDKKIDEMAQHNFKSDKIDISKEELQRDWDKQHQENGLISKSELKEKIQIEAEYQKDLTPLTAREAVQISVANFNENEVVATEKQITDMSLKMTRGNLDINDIKSELDRLEKDTSKFDSRDDKEVVFLKLNNKNERTFTSKELFTKEREIVSMLSNQKKFDPVMDLKTAENYLEKFETQKGFTLSNGQREAFKYVLTTDEQFISIQGKPGVGKTTLLEGLYESVKDYKGKEYADNFLNVLAPTGKAASGAMQESGINGSTVDSFLIKSGGGSQDVEDTLKEIKSIDRQKVISKEDISENKKDNSSNAKSTEKNETKDKQTSKSNINDMNSFNKDERFKIGWIKGLPSEEHKNKINEMTKSKEWFGFNSRSGKIAFKGKSVKNSFVNDKGNYVIRERSLRLGITRETEILPEKQFSSMRKTTTKFRDNTRKEAKAKTTNIFGKNSGKVDRTWYGKAKKDENGYVQYKDTLSKKVSDLVYKDDFNNIKNFNNRDEKLEFDKRETSLLNGAIFKNKSETKVLQNDNRYSITEKKEQGSVLGGMIKYKSVSLEKSKGAFLYGKDKTLELEKRTEISIFGKKIDNDYINSLVNKSKSQEDKLTFKDIKDKANEVKTTITRYFDKDDKLDYQNTTKEKPNTVKTIELSKVSDDKTVATLNTYSKKGKDSYSLENTSSKSIDNNIEKVSNKVEEAFTKSDKKEENSKMHFIDESSMLGTNKAHALISEMEKSDSRGVFIGDINQLAAVDAGRSYNNIQENTTVIEINEMNRQRNADSITKEVVELMTDKKVSDSINLLDKQNNLKIETEAEFFERIKQETLKDQNNTFNVLLTRDEVSRFNEDIRDAKYGQEKLNNATKFETHQDKRLDGFQKMNSKNYKEGDVVGFKVETTSGKTRFNDYTVKEVNHDRNQILLSSDKKTFVVSLDRESKNITSVHQKEDKSFLEGDRVIFLKNNKKSGLMNGDFAEVMKVEGSKLSVKTDDGKYKTVDLNDNKNKQIDHAYATTGHKSQGMTKKNVNSRILSTDRMASYNMANVMGSRHSQSYTLSTDNKEALIKKVEQEEKKTTSLDVDSNEKTSNEDKYKYEGFDSTVEKSSKVEKEQVQEKEINKSAEKDVEISK